MPRYKANKPGFFNGKFKTTGSFVITSKALKPVPSWLTPVKEETAAQRKKRLNDESKKAAVNKKRKADESVDVNEVTFTDGKTPRTKGGGKARGAGVKTL